jgi:hypothetical protein
MGKIFFDVRCGKNHADRAAKEQAEILKQKWKTLEKRV